jgi:RNA polymerase sigma-70 factor (ECF subfamily)
MIRDNEIIERIKQGDVEQFESLFRSLIKDRDNAEDIVQDLFFRLWQDKEKISVESSLNGYLFRSVHNRCIHHIEHDKVVARHAEEMLYRQSGTQESPSDILHYKELQARIARILEKLPERCGKIFYMSRFEGLRYSEIAEKLSISIKTVESNMGRALKEFREELTVQ